MQAAVWFTSFNLAQGYLQMAMEEADIPKTAFRAGSSGLFEFTRMPCGLTNARASFCRLMEMVIGDQQFVTLLFYLDDICIFANSADQMLDRIELVFSRLKQYQLKIKPKKSFFFQTEVSFLGHVLSAKGISPNPEKVDKVRDWPIPKTSKEVHSFIGLASYYHRFIPNFTKWSKPLNALIMPPAHQAKVRRGEMKKSELTEFVWSKECQEGFDALKQALTTAPVLAYPDYTQPFILETDASLKGLGAVLSQKGKDREVRVIAYASRSLRPSERSMRDYSSAKIELMALKWSVCEKFKDYSLGSKFTVFTDNNPLVYVKTSKLGAAQIHWLSELALYDFDIVYHTGRSNLMADALSCRPEAEGENHNQTCSDNDDKEWQAISYSAICEELQGIIGGVKVEHSLRERIQVVQSAKDDIYGSCKIEVIAGMVDVFHQVPSTTMAEHQAKDNQLAPVLEWVREGKQPTKAVIYQIRSKNTRQLMYQFHRLILKDGVLHHRYIHNDVEYHQLVLPQRYHKKILQSLHNDLGHQGIDRTLDLVRERVYWPTMTQDASSWVEQCRRCQVGKGNYNIPKPKYGHLIAHNPLDLVCLDFTKVDPSKGGKENVLVMTDAFTKFSVAVTTNNQQALTVAKALVERWFHVYGIPSRIHSDQGKSFDNKIIDALCKMYGVERTMTSPYNPRGNSQCKRFNHTMFGLLKTLTKEQKGNWPSHLPTLTFAYNATPHSTTSYQPYELMFGRKAPAPCDNWLGLRQYNDDKSISKVVWVDKQFEKIVQANKRVLKSIQARAKVNERSSGDKDFDIPIGNLVLLCDHPEGQNKIQDDYKPDLFEVTGKHSDPNAFFVKPLDGKGLVKQVN